MSSRPFTYERANSTGEAIEMARAADGNARFLAGGQSLLPLVNLGLVVPGTLIDLGRIPSLRTIESAGGEICIGAMTTYRALAESAHVRADLPLLAAALNFVGNARVRNMGTIGGSLVHNDPAAELPLVMTLLDASYELSDGIDTRSVPVSEFSAGPFETSIGPFEVMTEIHVPLRSGWSWGFREFSYRPGDFAVAAAGALVKVENGEISAIRAGITGTGSGSLRCTSYEEAALGRTGAELPAIEVLAIEDVPYVMDGVESSEYRGHVASVMLSRAVEDALRAGPAA